MRKSRRASSTSCATMPTHGDHPDQHRQHGDLGQHRRAESGEPLVDQRRQHEVVAGNAEQRGNAEVAEARDEAQRDAGEERRRHQRQHDRAQHRAAASAPPASAASISSCGSVRRPARSVRNTSGAYWTPSTRIIPAGRVQRIAAAQRRRHAERASAADSTGRTSAATRAPRPAAPASAASRSRRRTRCGRGCRSATRPARRRRRSATASAVPPNAVTRLCPVAVHVARSTARARSASAGQLCRPARRLRAASRASGSTDSTSDDADQPPEQRVVLEPARATRRTRLP